MARICKDCKHFVPATPQYSNNRCHHVKNFTKPPEANLVTGEIEYGIVRHAPHMLRNDGFWYARVNNTCGIEGRWYTPIKFNDDYAYG
jgi:hypothetical protein